MYCDLPSTVGASQYMFAPASYGNITLTSASNGLACGANFLNADPKVTV